ncbi:MAG: hypothetical protein AAF004_03600 [Pseudomonadota bacterium]
MHHNRKSLLSPMDANEMYNMRVGVIWKELDVSLYVNNASDSRAVVRALGRPPFDPDARIRVTPRTIGLSIRASF